MWKLKVCICDISSSARVSLALDFPFPPLSYILSLFTPHSQPEISVYLSGSFQAFCFSSPYSALFHSVSSAGLLRPLPANAASSSQPSSGCLSFSSFFSSRLPFPDLPDQNSCSPSDSPPTHVELHKKFWDGCCCKLIVHSIFCISTVYCFVFGVISAINEIRQWNLFQ